MGDIIYTTSMLLSVSIDLHYSWHLTMSGTFIMYNISNSCVLLCESKFFHFHWLCVVVMISSC